ncbi:MAG: hypothetical protein JW763_04780 [candidate division Zixibacteria bacterium]|nr:hypothetical protein [candidate division Zixibacteria bacterium]
MSAGMIPIMGGMAAIAASAARKKRMEEQEEKMTTYDKNDLQGWEFKIVRSAFGAFRNPEKVRRLCEEEARTGWEMLEKFDDSRIRFKRRTDRRSSDQYLEKSVDPYRTGYSSGGSAPAIIIGAIVALFVGILTFVGITIGFERPAIGGLTVAGTVFLIAFILILLALILIIRTVRRG